VPSSSSAASQPPPRSAPPRSRMLAYTERTNVLYAEAMEGSRQLAVLTCSRAACPCEVSLSEGANVQKQRPVELAAHFPSIRLQYIHQASAKPPPAPLCSQLHHQANSTLPLPHQVSSGVQWCVSMARLFFSCIKSSHAQIIGRAHLRASAVRSITRIPRPPPAPSACFFSPLVL